MAGSQVHSSTLYHREVTTHTGMTGLDHQDKPTMPPSPDGDMRGGMGGVRATRQENRRIKQRDNRRVRRRKIRDMKKRASDERKEAERA